MMKDIFRFFTQFSEPIVLLFGDRVTQNRFNDFSKIWKNFQRALQYLDETLSY